MSVTRRTTLRALGAAGATLAASGTVLAVGEHEDDEREPDAEEEDDEVEPVDPAGAAVRVGHFSPDAPNVDVYVDGEQVLADLAYDEVSDYLEIDPGTYTVEVTAAGDPETVAFEGDVELGQAFYTIAAIGELEAGTFEPLVLVDAGAALARLVHASPDAPAVDVFPAGAEESLFANVSFGDATDYVPLPVGEYELEVRPAADEPMANDATDDAADHDENAADDHDDVEENDVDDDADHDENDVDDDLPVDEMEEAVFTVSVDLAPATAYTGYAIGYLMPEGDQPAFDVNVTVDGPFADEEPPEVMPDEPPEEAPEEEPEDEPEEDVPEDDPDDDAVPEDEPEEDVPEDDPDEPVENDHDDEENDY
nr:DUF4397 domain-containing protein [Natronobeatus ordinarius]